MASIKFLQDIDIDGEIFIGEQFVSRINMIYGSGATENIFKLIVGSNNVILDLDPDQQQSNSNIQFRVDLDSKMVISTNVITLNEDLTVSTGNITLSGTGRIQGIDTVTAATDAASKAYVDTAVGGAGTVTSVGLSMPAAFSVSGSPVTSSGTLTVTGAGTNAQVVLGDGTLGTYTTGTMSSFSVSPDSGLVSTISNGDTLQIRGTTGNIITSSSTSDKVDINLVTTAVTAGSYTSADITVDAYGRITAAADGDEVAESVHIPVKNTSGATITKGTPVYITGNVGASDRLQIAEADASDAAKMPAVGLLLTDLANNGEGFVVQGGYLTNITTSTIDGTSTSSNDTVYVKAGGGLTMTKPTGSTNYIQNIAKIARVGSSSDGSLVVSSILRTNDIPNLPNGQIWVGTTTYPTTTALPTGTVTSVGLSMPSAFTVTNSPVTSSGTLTVSGGGTTSQYIDGTGALQTFPTIPGTPTLQQVTTAGNTSTNSIRITSGQYELYTGTTEIGVIKNTLGVFHIRSASTRDIKLGSTTYGDIMFLEGTDGSVGIGTSSPSAKLDVIDASTELLAQFGNNNQKYYLQIGGVRAKFGYDQNDAVVQGGNTKGISFYTNDTAFATSSNQRMRITSSGAIGIGTSSPSARTHIVGSGTTSATTALLVENNSGTDGLVVKDNADVTVGNALFVSGGQIYSNYPDNLQPIIDNSSSGDTLIIGDTALDDSVTQIDFNTFGALQLRIEDGESIFSSGITANAGILINTNQDLTLSTSSELILRDNTKIVYDTNITTNSQMNGTIIKSVSSSTVQGVLYALTANTPAWEAADADSSNTTNLLAIAASTNATSGMLLNGVFRDSTHGFTVGAPLYVSNTAGVLTNTAPTGTGDYVRVVGYAIDANHIYFNPDNTWVQIS